MNEMPPTRDPPDDLDDRYRRASDLDSSRPSERVRRAVLQNAQQLAAERAAKKGDTRIGSPPRRAANPWWRPAIFGSLAAAALAGLLITPHFLATRAPLTSASAPASSLARAPAVEPSPPSSVSAETSNESRNDMLKQEPASPSPAPPSPAPRSLAEANMAAQQSHSADAATDARSKAQGMAMPAVPLAEPASPPARELNAGAARQLQPALSKDPAAALRRAAEIGDIPAIRALLDAQVDIEARDSAGRTSLMLATLHGQAKTVDALLARGANPNAADAQGTTPLQAALSADQPAIVAALRRAGARERTTPPE